MSAVAEVVSWLVHRAIAWPAEDDRIAFSDGLCTLFPNPLGLGTPLRLLLPDHNVLSLQRIAASLGIEAPKNKATLVESLLDKLSDRCFVRAVADEAAPDVREELLREANATGDVDDHRFDWRVVQQRNTAYEWASTRGLMLGGAWGYGWVMPAEVGLALQGPDVRSPFSPRRPPVAGVPLEAEVVDKESAAAATLFAEGSLAVLDLVARTGVVGLKSGGIGARELAKWAKATGSSEWQVRLVFEVSSEAGLIEQTPAMVTCAEPHAQWRESEPAERLVALLLAWWAADVSPTESRSEDGKALAALSRGQKLVGRAFARQALLQTYADLPAATSYEPSAVASATRWAHPLVAPLPQDGVSHFASEAREAQAFGVLAHGALSRLGRLLLSADEAGLVAHASDLLPATSDRAVFDTDLTVKVVGAPSARLSALLDSTADREGRGGATVWRVSRASVRRAFDGGISAEQLLGRLSEVAHAALPQPLDYLIAEVGRAHGRVKVSSATACLTSEDTGLLTQIAAERKLKRLGLRLLAPTVLSSAAPTDETVAALRDAGYLPMPEAPSVEAPAAKGVAEASAPDRDAVGSDERTVVPRLTGSAREVYVPPPPADPDELATRLLGADPSSADDDSETVQRLAEMARRLSQAEIRILADALDRLGPVMITYRSQTGGTTRRVISEAALFGTSIYAWCGLREAERVFNVDRILTVSPAI